MKKIYGDDITIDTTPLPPPEPLFKPDTEVYYIDSDEYEEFIKEKTIPKDDGRKLRFVNSFWDPKKEKICISIGVVVPNFKVNEETEDV